MVTREETLAQGATPERIDKDTEELWPGKLVEINPNGEIVWFWRFWDHYSDKAAGNTDNPGRVDINLVEAHFPDINRDMTHYSTIDYDPVNDDILISARMTSEVYVIDHSTANYDDPASGTALARGSMGAIKQRFGNPGNYGAGRPHLGRAPGDRLFFLSMVRAGLKTVYPEKAICSCTTTESAAQANPSTVPLVCAYGWRWHANSSYITPMTMPPSTRSTLNRPGFTGDSIL